MSEKKVNSMDNDDSSKKDLDNLLTDDKTENVVTSGDLNDDDDFDVEKFLHDLEKSNVNRASFASTAESFDVVDDNEKLVDSMEDVSIINADEDTSVSSDAKASDGLGKDSVKESVVTVEPDSKSEEEFGEKFVETSNADNMPKEEPALQSVKPTKADAGDTDSDENSTKTETEAAGAEAVPKPSIDEPKFHRSLAEAEEDYQFFWKEYEPFSQWHFSKFTIDGINFSSAEQYMMYKKAVILHDDDLAEKILQCNNPRQMKAYGRQTKQFSADLWYSNCLHVVKEGNRAKYLQNEDLKEMLFSTYPKILVESSPYDRLWGIGFNRHEQSAWNECTWEGYNLLGFLLTELRDEILCEEDKIPPEDKQVYFDKLTKNLEEFVKKQEMKAYDYEKEMEKPIPRRNKNLGDGRKRNSYEWRGNRDDPDSRQYADTMYDEPFDESSFGDYVESRQNRCSQKFDKPSARGEHRKFHKTSDHEFDNRDGKVPDETKILNTDEKNNDDELNL